MSKPARDKPTQSATLFKKNSAINMDLEEVATERYKEKTIKNE